MSKPRKDQPLKMPRYKGGMQALKAFIKNNLNYPESALEQQVEGAVEVAYDVDGLGRIRNVKIVSGLGHGCDEEVIRLVNLLVYEKATNPGRHILSHKKLKVDFKLPAAKVAAKASTKKIQYHLTPAQNKPESKPGLKVGKSYIITISKKP
jgi:TonB family protein